ncbi:hypothetical protein [Phycicoccus sp.]|uniref:hypothetical protein n=1 Tax=Phycicoccus sp. TaxID=1902410 RepID=UPI00345E8F61
MRSSPRVPTRWTRGPVEAEVEAGWFAVRTPRQLVEPGPDGGVDIPAQGPHAYDEDGNPTG